MAEAIDDYPAYATTAAKEWIASKQSDTQPIGTTMREALKTHYSLSDVGTKLIGVSYLLARFIRSRA
jgi:hypothetical protein